MINITPTDTETCSWQITMTDVKYEMDRGWVYCVDIHHDGVRVVAGGTCDIDMWNINTGKTITTLVDKQNNVRKVKFVTGGVVYCDGRSDVHFITLDGNAIWTLNDMDISLWCFVPNEKYTIIKTALKSHRRKTQFIRVVDTNRGKVVFTFVDHRLQIANIKSFLELPTQLVAYGYFWEELVSKAYKFDIHN